MPLYDVHIQTNNTFLNLCYSSHTKSNEFTSSLICNRSPGTFSNLYFFFQHTHRFNWIAFKHVHTDTKMHTPCNASFLTHWKTEKRSGMKYIDASTIKIYPLLFKDDRHFYLTLFLIPYFTCMRLNSTGGPKILILFHENIN